MEFKDILTITAIVTAYIIVILGDTLKTSIKHPRLNIIDIDCKKQKADIKINDNHIKGADAFYYRFRTKNSGFFSIFFEKAEKVEIFAKELLDHRQEKIGSFIPRRFLWTHCSDTTYDIISPDMEKHCELLCYVDPKYTDNKNMIYLLLEAMPEPLPIDSTTYYLKVQLTSANSKKPIERILEIRWGEGWKENQKVMCEKAKGIIINLHKKLPTLPNTSIR